MITAKGHNALWIFVLFLIITAEGCRMYEETMEREFKVFGDSELLRQMIINVESSTNDPKYLGYPVSKVQTLLIKGQQYLFRNEDVIYYEIYFSIGNKVGKMSFDNAYRHKKNHINHIHIHTENNNIYLSYHGLNASFADNIELKSDTAITIENFFEKKGVLDDEEQQVYYKKFFNFFDPKIQQYSLRPLSSEFRDYYKNLSLEDQQKYNLPDEYLKQMN